jgi:hypothetical protein
LTRVLTFGRGVPVGVVRSSTGLNKELESVRDMLDRMVKWRLLYPFNADEAERFKELAAREKRLLEMLEASLSGDL